MTLMPFMFDPSFVLLIPAMLLAFYAQWRVRATYKKYREVPSASRMTGQEVARRLLSLNQVPGVTVEAQPGELTDHYDPRARVVRLSEHIYGAHSIAAVAVAAHEVGHAIQHAQGYAPLRIRHALVPVAGLTSQLGIPLFFIGMIFAAKGPVFLHLMDIGILFFSGAVLIQLVTLPVEFDASRRALRQLQSTGTLPAAEVGMARQMLNAAALTYVAAMAVAASHLIRMLLLRGAGGRRD
jgi:Zn-dependent membrane protease YugP